MINSKDLLKRISFLEEQSKIALATKKQIRDGYNPNIDSAPFHGFRSSVLSFLKSAFGEKHPFYIEFDDKTQGAGVTALLIGINILKSVKAEIENGWLQSYIGIISSDIFSDFLEMADHLLKNGYKDAAAVMIGSVLEEHLRQLCDSNGIDIETSKDGNSIPKKADLLNSELKKGNVYGGLDQKNVTSWLDLRNKAAHGKYGEYVEAQVKIMHSGVSEFLGRNRL